jgi:hypothetical protein
MRYLVLGAATLAVAGCGSSNSTDFTIEVQGNASSVKQRLATLHFTSESAIGIAPVTMASDGDALVFTIPAEEGYDPGEVKMGFAQNGPVASIAVAVDMPAVTMGAGQYLSEAKVEDSLEEELADWAKRYRTAGTGANTENLELTMAAMAIAAQRVNVNSVAFAGDFGGTEWGADDSEWDEGGSDYAYESSGDSGWGAGTDVSYDDGGWGSGS